MKKTILILTILLSTTLNVSAQKITNAEELKRFYTEYLSVMDSNGTKADSLVRIHCTKEFHKAWNEDVNEIGLYDPLTNGFGENPDLMKKHTCHQKGKQ